MNLFFERYLNTKEIKYKFTFFKTNDIQYNNQPEALEGGIYRFRFYRMGEWMDVIIDDQLPKKYAAKPKEKVGQSSFWLVITVY